MAELGEREPIEVPATTQGDGRAFEPGGNGQAGGGNGQGQVAAPARSTTEHLATDARERRRYACVIVRLYDSLTRELHDVSPVDGETVKIYSCGPTVYRYIHIGNMRSFMLGDLIRRALRFEGSRVRWIMNITDVGHMTDEVSDTGRDKMELAEADEGLSAAEIAKKYTDAFLRGLRPRRDRARRPVPARHRPHRRHDQADPDPDREGPRVRGRRDRLLRRHDVPRLRQALGQHARPAPRRPPPGGRGRPEQAPPRGLRAVEEGRARTAP